MLLQVPLQQPLVPHHGCPVVQQWLLEQVCAEVQQTLLQHDPPVAHLLPHVPQLLLSVFVLSHVQVEPEAQQAWSEVQLVPHVPQFGLVLGVMQTPPHWIWGGVQPVELPLVVPLSSP